MLSFRVLQLADAAFPAGGLPHSGGLEAAVQLGEVADVEDLVAFVRQTLWQVGRGALPFVASAHAAPGDLVALDRRCHAFVTGRVQRQASIAQGRAFVAACARSFPEVPGLGRLPELMRDRAIEGHLPPLFGAALHALGVARLQAEALYLHQTVRGVLSAAVRLGRLGPFEAQRVQHTLSPQLDQVLDACAGMAAEQATQVAPLVELLGAQHDRLFQRLFQS